jgi:hypothetical protein
METTILTLALAVIRAVIKNPAKKARLKSLLQKLRDAIDAAFADD